MSESEAYQYLDHLTYFGIFLWFALLEQITPVPEEVSLMTVGYLSIHNGLNPWICGLMALLGLSLADNLFFYFSWIGNRLIKKILNKTKQDLLENFKHKLSKNPKATLLWMAFIPKLRFLSPIISATTEISWKLFFYINTAAMLVYISIYILIGIFFHTQLKSLFHELALVRHSIFILVMLILSVYLIFKFGRIWNSKPKQNHSSNGI